MGRDWKKAVRDVAITVAVVGGVVACLALLVDYQKTADANEIFFDCD